ncbi:MAG TPA: RpiB/LacA/LacB family sugar-phosphate isomerase [Bryobacteraceae bacterium]|nr:RpiB/LacA/LacB family sugar-phosphate isomerase [Bryobacteraceae bacterium]
MKIAVASDLAGFPLKPRIIQKLGGLGHETVDLGTDSTDPVDYPDHSRAAVELVRPYIGARFSGAERHNRRLGKIARFKETFGR